VHGHDRLAREATANFIRKVGLEPIVVAEEATEGRTIIEALEHYGEADFAVVLFTPDDVGAERGENVTERLQPRARQNVVLEYGYFAGKLGRSKVCALCKAEVELPSDIHGLLYTVMDEADAWQLKLVREMNRAGLPVDASALL
jgi:predicted nucleotide-binding protein